MSGEVYLLWLFSLLQTVSFMEPWKNNTSKKTCSGLSRVVCEVVGDLSVAFRFNPHPVVPGAATNDVAHSLNCQEP